MNNSITLAHKITYNTFTTVMCDKIKPENILTKFYQKHEKSLKQLNKNFIKEIIYNNLH